MGPGYQLTKQAHGPLTTPFTPPRLPPSFENFPIPPSARLLPARHAIQTPFPWAPPPAPALPSNPTPREPPLPHLTDTWAHGPTAPPRARTSARHISSSRVGFPSPAWEFYLYTTCSTSHSKTQNSFPVSSASIGAGSFRIWGLRRLRRSWEVEKAAADSLGSIGLMATASGDQSAGIGFFFSVCLIDWGLGGRCVWFGRWVWCAGFGRAGSAARASKLRYPLRSASRGKGAADAPPTSGSVARRSVSPIRSCNFYMRVKSGMLVCGIYFCRLEFSVICLRLFSYKDMLDAGVYHEKFSSNLNHICCETEFCCSGLALKSLFPTSTCCANDLFVSRICSTDVYG